MIEDFFDHHCNIFHLKRCKEEIGYGIKNADTKFYYDDVPDIVEQACHFHVKLKNTKFFQGDPDKKLIIIRKLSLPIGTDVRVNDKIVDCNTGLEYTAQFPDNIRSHHITVLLTREQEQAIL